MSLSTLFSGIADAIRAKDGTTAPIVANDFPARIQAIQTGSKPGTPLDPRQVYEDTRPADWLPMPEPQDNEMYLLVHIPDGASSLLAFTVTCGYSSAARVLKPVCWVSFGTVVDGNFVAQKGAGTQTGEKYETELFADDYGNLTSDGMKQVMIKLEGAEVFTWEPSTHSKKTSPSDFCDWNIVEIACKLPNGTKVTCGNSSENKALKKLRYFTWKSENAVTDMSNMFNGCYSLTAIPALDTSNVTKMSNMFNDCYSLTAIPALDTSSVTDMSCMFSSCYSLTTIPALDTSGVTNMGRMFCFCSGLTVIPELNTASVTDMNSMFNACSNLTTIPELNTASVTNMDSMFIDCCSLTTIPELNTASVTNMSSMFGNCYSLTTIPELNTASVTNMRYMFSDCYSLTVIHELNTASVTNMSGMFSACYSLTAVLFKPTVTGWAGYAIDLKQCSLRHKALVNLFNSLPTITASKKLTLTGNLGVSELTDAEKAIATGKNWTLTL